MRLEQQRPHMPRLPKRQRAAARADQERAGGQAELLELPRVKASVWAALMARFGSPFNRSPKHSIESPMAGDGKHASLTVLGIETSCDETAAAVVRRNEDGSGEILVERGALAARPACGLWRRGAGDRRPRPCRAARSRDQPGAGRGRARLRCDRRGRRDVGPGPGRRLDRRRHHGQGHRARAGRTLHRRQSSGGACAHRRPDASAGVSVSAAARLGRAYPAPRGQGRGQL